MLQALIRSTRSRAASAGGARSPVYFLKKTLVPNSLKITKLYFLPNIVTYGKNFILDITEKLPYEFLGFLNESNGLECDICPKLWPQDIPKMACAEVLMNDTGRQFVCHESG